jgi:transposase InsO family protein
LEVTRQAFYNHLKNLGKPYKHELLAALIRQIIMEDECNDRYGSARIREAALLKLSRGETGVVAAIPSEGTIRRIMKREGLTQVKRRRPNGLTKADKLAQKSDDLLRRDFTAENPLQKAVCDVTEVKCSEGKLYVSALLDCYDNAILAVSASDTMKAELVVQTLTDAATAYPGLRGAIAHSDRGSQYTSELYRAALARFGVVQSMNSAGGRCHDNAKAESLWARFKEELLYGRYNAAAMRREDVRSLIWRYFMSYWNNRRICSANGGLPPMEKRRRYYEGLARAA